MSKQERRRVRVAASLGLTVLMSSAILGGVAPLTANAAEVGSEPTTTEVSTMITAPENPSDAVVSLPEREGVDTGMGDETPLPDEESEEVEAETPTRVPESASEIEEKLPEQSQPEPSVEAPAIDAVQADELTSDEDGVIRDTWGDVEWTFKDGVLSLAGGTGVNTNAVSPWRSIAGQVTKVEITGRIIAPQSIHSLFANFSAVKSFEGLSNMDTSNVTKMWNAFYGTSSLESIDLRSWNVANVDDMDSMFAGSGLISLDLSTWQLDADPYLYDIFSSMHQLEYLNISSWSSPNKMDLFDGDTLNLTTIVLGTETRLTNLNAGPDFMWQGENTGVTFYSDYTGDNADTYHKVPVESERKWGSVSWTIENNTLYLSGGEGASVFGDAPWAPFETEINSVVIEDSIIAPEKIGSLFANLNGVTSYDGLEKLNVSKTTDMNHMFDNNSNVTTLDLSNWDTRNVTDMSDMFRFNLSLTGLDLSNWDTSNVTDMSGMFSHNESLTGPDLSTWDTGNVTDMSDMFAGNDSLTGLDLSNWNTGNVTNMSGMFRYNDSLTGLDLSNWDTCQ